jgi:hypothetical protein
LNTLDCSKIRYSTHSERQRRNPIDAEQYENENGFLIAEKCMGLNEKYQLLV